MTRMNIKPSLIHITTVPISLRFFRGQVGYLRDHGFSVQVISSPGQQLDDFASQEGISYHSVSMEREISPLKDLVSLWRLWRILRTTRPTIVHSHTPKAGLLGTIAARLAGIPVVFISVFGLPQMTQKGLSASILNLTTRVSTKLADRVWCDSFSMRDYVIQSGLSPADKVMVVGFGSVNGVDATGRFSPSILGVDVRADIRSTYQIPNDATVLGFVGRIVGDKGIHELASAWRSLRDKFPNAHLLLVGPFETKDAIRPEDDFLLRSDSRIHLAGMREDVAEHFAAMDIFVMPSYREGFGITNIEAAAMALPVVSTRIPGCVDSVEDGVTGTLVPPRDAQALEHALERYMADGDLRRRHGAAGRERVLRDFRPETIWESLYCEYTTLLSKRSKTRR